MKVTGQTNIPVLNWFQKLLNTQFQLVKHDWAKPLGEGLFLAAFFAFSFGSWYTLTSYQSFFGVGYGHFKKIMYGITLIFLVLKLILQKYKIKNILLIGLIGVMLFISSKLSGSRTLVWIFLFIISAQGISLVSVAYVLLSVLLLIGIFAFGGYFFGAVNDYILSAVGDRSVRHSIGFGHPNTLAIYLYTFFLALMTVKKWQPRLLDVVFGMILVVFEYIVSGSRYVALCFAITILVVVCQLFFQQNQSYREKWVKPIQILVKAVSCISLSLSLIALFFFNPDNLLWTKLDRFTSGRLHLMHSYYAESGLSILGAQHHGTNIEFYSAHGDPLTFVVDNLFARLLLTYGILCGGMVILALFMSEWKLLKARNFVPYCFSIFIMIGVVEAIGTHLEINFFLIAIGAVLYSEDLRVLISTDSILKHLALYRLLAGLPSAKRRGRHALETAPNEDKDFLERIQSKERQPAHVSKQ